MKLRAGSVQERTKSGEFLFIQLIRSDTGDSFKKVTLAYPRSQTKRY
jgi:hypothetical protein